VAIVSQTQANSAISTGFMSILDNSKSLDSSGQEQPFHHMLTQNEHNLFGVDLSPFKKQWISTPGLALSLYHIANDYDASNALLSLAQYTSSPDHSMAPTHVSLSPTMTSMSASTSITTSTLVALILVPSTTLSVTGNSHHDGTIHDANFAKMTDKKGG
jgi:hypothetical protein